MSADDFMWEVAEQLQDRSLTRDADFQEFCLNTHDSLTVAEAAETWGDRE